jgi:hypothetical protein
MSIDHGKREGVRLLSGIENGTLSTADAYNVAEKLDPVLVYFTLRYLREKYPASSPSAEGVSRRLVELTSTYDDLVKRSKEGEKDSLREWFDDTYNLREFFDKPEELVELLVEKIEG